MKVGEKQKEIPPPSQSPQGCLCFLFVLPTACVSASASACACLRHAHFIRPFIQKKIKEQNHVKNSFRFPLSSRRSFGRQKLLVLRSRASPCLCLVPVPAIVQRFRLRLQVLQRLVIVMQKFTLSPSLPVYVGGSRNLSSTLAAHTVVKFALAASKAGFAFHVGCASGADAALLSCLPLSITHHSRCRVFAQFSSSGQGAFKSSAVQAVKRAASFGVPVRYLAGGSLSVPVSARLIRRSLAGLAGAGVAVFFAPGVGSLSVARHAIAQGIPVLVWSQVFPSSIPSAKTPVRVSFFGLTFWFFEPAQKNLL